MDCLATLLEKSDRVSKLQDNLKRVQMAMVELVPELDLETFSVRTTLPLFVWFLPQSTQHKHTTMSLYWPIITSRDFLTVYSLEYYQIPLLSCLLTSCLVCSQASSSE